MRAALVIGALLALAAPGPARSEPPLLFELGPSDVVYPRAAPTLRFSHRQHMALADVGCERCHAGIEATSSAAESEGPGHAACVGCHASWLERGAGAPPNACARCHIGAVPAATSTTALEAEAETALIFSHRRHTSNGVECQACHARTAAAERPGAELPTMERCVDCHHRERVATQCEACHPVDARGKLVQRFRSGLLVPRRFSPAAAHVIGFERAHAAAAERERGLCQECHDTGECLVCHDGIGRDTRYHPDPWILQHGLRGAADQGRCQACHRTQSFCLACHQRSGVAVFGPLDDPLQRPSARRVDPSSRQSPPLGPHPMAADGWLDPASPRSHGPAARRRIQSCASCHQEQFCILCHGSAFGGRNGPNPAANPHGPNPERLRSVPAARQNARVCLKCHSPVDPRWRPSPPGR